MLIAAQVDGMDAKEPLPYHVVSGTIGFCKVPLAESISRSPILKAQPIPHQCLSPELFRCIYPMLFSIQ